MKTINNLTLLESKGKFHFSGFVDNHEGKPEEFSTRLLEEKFGQNFIDCSGYYYSLANINPYTESISSKNLIKMISSTNNNICFR